MNHIIRAAVVAAFAVVAGCPLTPPPGTSPSSSSGGTGAGGGGAASSSSGASTGAGPGACVDPHPRAPDYRCRFATDCYDGSECSVESCAEENGKPCGDAGCADGRCSYRTLADGDGCDQGLGWHGVCRSASCCQRDAPSVAAPR